MENESIGDDVEPSEKEPPIIVDAESEQEPTVGNQQGQRQVMRRL